MRERGASLTVRVQLAADQEEAEASESGAGGPTVALRIAASATLSAVRNASPSLPELHLMGAKTVQAFDREVALVAVHTPGPPSRVVLGAVPVVGSREKAASLAALDAVNRLLSEGPTDTSQPEGRE